MTTGEHLRFYARIKGVAEVERDVNTVLDNTGLRAYEHRLASKLSGGNQRKLSIAIALLGALVYLACMLSQLTLTWSGNPPVLILDEPSSSIDAVSKRVLWRTLTHMTRGRSLLLTVLGPLMTPIFDPALTNL
jgi:ABC-type multidrug transport system ATPase subunit